MSSQENLKQQQKPLDQQEFDINDPQFKQNIQNLIEIKGEEQSNANNFFKNFNYFYVDKDRIRKILLNLEYAGMTNDLRNYPNNYAKTMNLFVFGSFFTIFKLWKQTSKRLFLGASVLILKGFYFDYLMTDWHFRKISQNGTDQFSQELRNLYRFYYSEEPIVEDLEIKCKEYLEVQNIRKEIYKMQNRV